MFALYVIVPYLAVMALFVVLQRRIIYYPTVAGHLSIEESGLGAGIGDDVELSTPDGNRLGGWLVRCNRKHHSDVANTPLILYFPGNAHNRLDRVVRLRDFARRGFDTLIFDYRGYGDSTGAPSEAALSRDALHIWDYVLNRLGYPEHRVVVFGESLGGAVALSMWSETNQTPPRPAAVILQSTFASLARVARWHYPLFPFQLFLRDRWTSIDRIGRVESPITLLHGRDDDIVPVSHGKELARVAQRALFIELPGVGHNDVPLSKIGKELDSIFSTFATGETE